MVAGAPVSDGGRAVDAVPPPRPGRLLDAACLSGLILSVALSYALLPATPALLGRHPQVLELLTGSTPATVAAGAFARVGRLPLLLAMLAPLVPAAVFDPFFWWAGRRFGNQVAFRLAGRSERARAGVLRSERFLARWGAWALVAQYYLPFPVSLIRLGAGTSGVPLLRFVLADLVGTLLWYLPAAALGYAVGAPAVRLVHDISHDSLLVGAAVLAAVLLAGWVRRRRGR